MKLIMNNGSNKLLQCFLILLKTSTIPRRKWIWLFATIFFTLLRYPNLVLKKNWTGKKKHFLSDYLPHSITVKDPNGILFIARPKYEDLARFLFAETLAKWEPRDLIKLDESQVMIDVGANTGYYSLNLAKRYNNAKIIAIEANPETCNILEKNCKLNKLTNVKIHNLALSDKEGKITLYQTGIHSGANSIFAPDSSYQSKGVTVNSSTLDNLLAGKFNNIEWIKIDVEGAELSVLRGSLQTLKITKKILIEIHEHILKQNNEKPEEIIEILKKNGFKIRLFSEFWNKNTSPNQKLKSDYIMGEK